MTCKYPRLLIALASLALSACGGGSPDDVGGNLEMTAPKPEDRPLDLGEVVIGTAKQAEVQFRVTENSLTIDSLAVSGTHAAEFAASSTAAGPWPHTQSRILYSGYEGVIDVTFTPGDTGERTARLQPVLSPGQHGREWPLTLKGTGVNQIITGS